MAPRSVCPEKTSSREPCRRLSLSSSHPAFLFGSSGCSSEVYLRRSSGRAGMSTFRFMRDALGTFAVFVTGSLSLLLCGITGASGLVIEEPFQESFYHVPATFGPDVLSLDPAIASRPLVSARPRDACIPLYNAAQMGNGAVALVERGHCNFTQKIIHAQQAGASAVVVTDNERTERWYTAMSGERQHTKNIRIPAVFVSHETGERLWSKRLWPSNSKIRASVNATGHVPFQPRSIGAMETLGVYLLVSLVLVGFSGLCGVLFAISAAWYQRSYRTRAMRRLRTFTYRRPREKARRGRTVVSQAYDVVSNLIEDRSSASGANVGGRAAGTARRFAARLAALTGLDVVGRSTTDTSGADGSGGGGGLSDTAIRCAARLAAFAGLPVVGGSSTNTSRASGGPSGDGGGGGGGGQADHGWRFAARLAALVGLGVVGEPIHQRETNVVAENGQGSEQRGPDDKRTDNVGREKHEGYDAPSGAGAEGDGGHGGNQANGMRAEDDTCAICLDIYEDGVTLTALKCRHCFHVDCIRPWLSGNGVCPICKGEAFDPTGRKAISAFLSTAGSRLETARAELTEMCTDNLFMLGSFFLTSVVCGVVAAEFSVRD